MLLQLHHQYKDYTEIQAQKDISFDDGYGEMEEWIKEIRQTHPVPVNAQWMVCNEKSEFFAFTFRERGVDGKD